MRVKMKAILIDAIRWFIFVTIVHFTAYGITLFNPENERLIYFISFIPIFIVSILFTVRIWIKCFGKDKTNESQ